MRRSDAVGWLWRWGPALVIMAVMFTASSRPETGLPDFGLWDRLVKKAGHLLGYALLGAAYSWALTGARPADWRAALAAAVLAGLYGATDEFHQSFVPGRGASPADVGIDTLGGAIGALTWLRLSRYLPRRM